MRCSEGCVSNRDGSLDMARGAVADTVAFAESGRIALSIAGQALQGGAASVVVRLNGNQLGELRVGAGEMKNASFEAAVPRRGPQSLRFEVTAAAEVAASVPLLRLQKVVIRQ
jgi:hypothetical protein